ncbi:MAG: hypothetical protein ACH346_04905 [Chthoniobacterales bacterium]
MELLPHPQESTQQEIAAQNKLIHKMLFSAIPVHVIGFILAVVIVAIAISYNFNVMQWLE